MRWCIYFGACVAVVFGGCAKPGSAPESASGAPEIRREGKSSISPVLAAAKEQISKGAYDDAAAQLVGMRGTGHQFTDREAAEYRRTLNDAYLQAMEAAQKGDARAKAAVEMIRNANH